MVLIESCMWEFVEARCGPDHETLKKYIFPKETLDSPLDSQPSHSKCMALGRFWHICVLFISKVHTIHCPRILELRFLHGKKWMRFVFGLFFKNHRTFSAHVFMQLCGPTSEVHFTHPLNSSQAWSISSTFGKPLWIMIYWSLFVLYLSALHESSFQVHHNMSNGVDHTNSQQLHAKIKVDHVYV